MAAETKKPPEGFKLHKGRSPFMDRTAPSMGKGQIAFMNYIVVPLFELISEFVPHMRFTIDLADGNKCYWVANDDG